MGWLKDMCCATAIAGVALYIGYGYGRRANSGFQYAVDVQGEHYVVQDRASGAVQRINEEFQLGTIEHRVEGIFREMKRTPDTVERTIIDAFHKHYAPREEQRGQWVNARARWPQ